MATHLETIRIRLSGKRRVSAALRGHTVLTDQPTTNGGEDSAPSPFELFLASLGTCAGIFVQGFCANRNIPYESITLDQTADYGPDGVLSGVTLLLNLPPDFPDKYKEAVVKVAEQCSVKKAIFAQPTVRVLARPQTSSS